MTYLILKNIVNLLKILNIMAYKFLFVLLPHTHLLDLAGPDQAILESIDFGADFEIEYCSIKKEVNTSSGLNISSLQHYSDCKLKPGDFIVIPGPKIKYVLSDEFKNETGFFEWLRKQYSMNINLCSICSGAFALAHSGLLNGLEATTHFKRTKELAELFPLVKVRENILFTEQKGVYTSAGIASGIDLTLHIIEKLKGSYFAYKVARELVVYNRRNGEHSQKSILLEFRNHMHYGIHRAQDMVNESLDKGLAVADLADAANMSERNFTRIFKKETGITVGEYIRKIRVERINQLMKNPDISRLQIARKCGLKSERQLRRIINYN